MENLFITETKKLFKRDLLKLKKEIELYKKEENLWIIEKEISNTAGNLCLHLVGNLNAFICAELGGTGYIRQRDKEFSLKNVSRKELLDQIDQTIIDVEKSLDKVDDGLLQSIFPKKVFSHEMTTQYFLIHLYGHFSYHLGQINYHRRLLDN